MLVNAYVENSRVAGSLGYLPLPALDGVGGVLILVNWLRAVGVVFADGEAFQRVDHAVGRHAKAQRHSQSLGAQRA